jgi:hypothetical protein
MHGGNQPRLRQWSAATTAVTVFLLRIFFGEHEVDKHDAQTALDGM